jgi:NAD(P)-dependent dehydrogenase (short-subunit alcohol dehydrogenase family)
MRELKGRTAVITGGASGIGLATARSLAREGVKLVLADIEQARLSEAWQGSKRTARRRSAS